jgi:hypothetical protein
LESRDRGIPGRNQYLLHLARRLELDALDMQSDRPKCAGLPQRKFAAEWLQRQLAKGPLSRGTIESAAQRDGLSITTVRRAKLDIGVLSYKNSFDGAWYWELLETYAAANAASSEAATRSAETQG